jgi:hypothetical protein
MRSACATKSGPPWRVTRATKSVIDRFAAPSFQDGNPSVCASADVGRSGPIRVGSTARVESSNRRLIPAEATIDFMFASLQTKDAAANCSTAGS